LVSKYCRIDYRSLQTMQANRLPMSDI
jgi:hypothetical protein